MSLLTARFKWPDSATMDPVFLKNWKSPQIWPQTAATTTREYWHNLPTQFALQ
jgi:hypothetical protein